MVWGRKTNKFGNEVISFGGRSFHSKLEAAVYQILLLREKAGEIEVLECQAHVYLTQAKIHCIPDFKIRDIASGQIQYVEAKGFANDRWPTIKKLWKVYGPGPLEIWGGNFRRPTVTDQIVPFGLRFLSEIQLEILCEECKSKL